MGLFNKLFSKKNTPLETTYTEFWNWFQHHEADFFQRVKNQDEVELRFFDRMSEKIGNLLKTRSYLTGMLDEHTAHLIFSADGNIADMVFAEDLVAAAPHLPNWKFEALKPAMPKEDFSIHLGDQKFGPDNLHFYYEEHPNLPDYIDITVVHDYFTPENSDAVTRGTFIFLDNYLGELNFATTIDHMRVIGKEDATNELIPISKLADFLKWREKEFVEKYEGPYPDAETENHAVLQTQAENGLPLLFVMNIELLNWDNKPSHPWILQIEIPYDGKKNEGMPGTRDYERMNQIEDEIHASLTRSGGHLNLGRKTGNNLREVYMACKDFREASRLLSKIAAVHRGSYSITYEFYKDKYWNSFQGFRQASEEDADA